VLGGFVAQALLLTTLVLPGAVAARATSRILARATLATLPLAIAVSLVSVLTRPGATVLFVIGPFDATLEGVTFAALVALRLFVMAAALALFGMTTSPHALMTDLQRRRLPPRLAFAAAAILDALPAMVARARAVTDAQRARGLDTEGGIVRRARGVMPLVGPVVIGSLHDVEARSVALDARAFGRPGPRRLLWSPPDTAAERRARWLLLGALAVAGIAMATGAIPRLP